MAVFKILEKHFLYIIWTYTSETCTYYNWGKLKEIFVIVTHVKSIKFK